MSSYQYGTTLCRNRHEAITMMTEDYLLAQGMNDWAMPEVQAELVLGRYWSPGVFPVDPVSIAQGLGIRVLDAELPDEVSGAIIKRPGQDPVILIEVRDSQPRRRFTCAHEIGHFVYSVEILREPDTIHQIDLRGPASGLGDDESEIFANQFAANLLMPADTVKRRHRKSVPIWEIAAYFGVSSDAMLVRLRSLGLAAR